jgi:hypothetical protein
MSVNENLGLFVLISATAVKTAYGSTRINTPQTV